MTRYPLPVLLLGGAVLTSALQAADAPAPSPSAPAANSTPAATDLWTQPFLFGDAGGWRTKLNDAGWQPFATLKAEVWDNVRGGVRTGMTDDLLFTFGGEADLEKLTGWKGATFRASFNYVQGNRPDHNTGAYSSPTFLDASDQFRAYNLYLRQKLWDDQITLKIGQIGIDDDFCQPTCLGVFLNAGLTAPPAFYGQTLADGDASLPQYSVDAPGIFARFDPKDLPIYTMSGIYLSDPGPGVSNNHGFDWRTSNGVAFLQEVGWNYQIAQKSGTLSVGGFYNDGQFTNWDTGLAQRGIYGAYAYVNQTLCQTPGVNGGDPQPVLLGFLYAGWSGPNKLTGPNCDYACGLEWNGPFPGRPSDIAGLAVLYTGFSKNYTRSAFNPNGAGVSTASETIVELTYQAALTPWFSLQPDVQVIFNPANAGTRANAVVIGARATISF